MKKFDIDLIGLMIIAIILLGVCLFIQGIEIDLIIEGVEKMAHEKVYGVCEDMCLEETMTKAEIEVAINNASVKDGSITNDKLADLAVTNSKIQDHEISTDKLLNGCVNSDKLANSAVKTEHIYGGSVTQFKIADGAVVEEKLGDYSVTTNKLANNAVNTNKIADKAVTSEKIGTGEVKMTNIGKDAVTNFQLSSDAVFTIGSYTGNSASGHIDIGFKPRVVLILAHTDGLQAMLTENGASVSYVDSNDKACCDGTDTAIFDETGVALNAYVAFNKSQVDYTYIAFR